MVGAATPWPGPLERPANRLLVLQLQQNIIYQSVVSKPRGGLPLEPSQSLCASALPPSHEVGPWGSLALPVLNVVSLPEASFIFP